MSDNQANVVIERNIQEVHASICKGIKWTREQIDAVLRDIITGIQVEGGNAVPDFVPDLCIMQEVVQFDSLVAIDAVMRLSVHFGVELPEEIFYDVETSVPFTLAQVIDRIYDFLNPDALEGAQAE